LLILGYDHIFLSINRYERKKKIELALESLIELRNYIDIESKLLPTDSRDNLKGSKQEDDDFVMIEKNAEVII